MQELTLTQLKNKATELRIRVVDMIWKAQSGHPGGSLSVADFMTACYFRYMKVDPKNPRWADRDRFVLSKGHVCPAQYAALAMTGFFPMEVLDTLRKEGSPLQGHPSMTKCPGIDISTGSLGQGLACAAGMALAAKLDGKDYNVFCALGDGETNEGEIWEACGTAHKYKLDNLVVFVDWNNLQLDGTCEEIMPLLDLKKKFDLVLCICDSINYLYEEELDAFFKCASKHLNEKGRLIFDMHDMKRIEEFKEQYIEEGFVSGVPYQWTITSDEYDDTLHEHFTFYTEEGMIEENHSQNVFDVDTIRRYMEPYFNIRVIDDFIEDEKLLIVGYKK